MTTTTTEWKYFRKKLDDETGYVSDGFKFSRLKTPEEVEENSQVDEKELVNFRFLESMPEAPEWRQFMNQEEFTGVKNYSSDSEKRWERILELAELDIRGKERGESLRLEKNYEEVVNAVNAAIHLRRPLLITGKPGTGKTSLAYAIAYELGLGAVLSWPINTRSKLEDALYQYDAIARLQDAQLTENKQDRKPIENYIRLGSVGTAFLPSRLPRVLLIDEIDKCDINLPNDLLNLFEEGSFEIRELVREFTYQETESKSAILRTADDRNLATIYDGKVTCYEFPIVVMTSNGERDFPPAFLRRCLRLRMPDPSKNDKALMNIVKAHLPESKNPAQWRKIEEDVKGLIISFMERAKDQTTNIATDQLLNAVYLLTGEVKPDDTKEGDKKSDKDKVLEILLKKLNEEGY